MSEREINSLEESILTPLSELRADAAMADEPQQQFYNVDELIANLENYDEWPKDPKKRVDGKKYIKKGKIVEAVVGKRGTPSKSTIEQIVIDSHIKNNAKYKYPIQEYINNRTKIEIICPIHGSFWQIPSDHLRGIGCNKCGLISSAAKNRNTLDDVRNKSIELHNGRYKIPEQEYVNTDTQIEIICPIHGSFWQTPHDHLSGKGCNKCGLISSAAKNRNTLDDVRNKSGCCPNGEKYIIPDQEYINNHTKIEIICPIHGSFWQRAGDHMKGCGCSLCKNKTEGKLFNFLKKEFTEDNVKRHNNYDWCKNPETKYYLPFDFIVFEKIIVELDGPQHIDTQIPNRKSPEEQQERDIYKMDQAINNEKHVIRILQYDVWNDTNDWKKKLIQTITELKDVTEPTIRFIGDCEVYKEYTIE